VIFIARRYGRWPAVACRAGHLLHSLYILLEVGDDDLFLLPLPRVLTRPRRSLSRCRTWQPTWQAWRWRTAGRLPPRGVATPGRGGRSWNDDSSPETSALEELESSLDVLQKLDKKPVLLASKVVWVDGELH
jgi:hypothetical protein